MQSRGVDTSHTVKRLGFTPNEYLFVPDSVSHDAEPGRSVCPEFKKSRGKIIKQYLRVVEGLI